MASVLCSERGLIVHRHANRRQMAPCRPAVPRAALSSRVARKHLSVVAFKDSDPIASHDWRITKMADTSKRLFGAFMSRGDLSAGESVLDADVVYRDNMFWGPGMLLGANKLKSLVQETRYKYPDMWYEINEMSMQDGTHVWVSWTGHGTNLEATGSAASYHNSTYSGVSVLTFNSDRSKVVEISVYRQPTAEEKRELLSAKTFDPLEIKLARLHWEPASEGKGAAPAASSAPAGKHGHISSVTGGSKGGTA